MAKKINAALDTYFPSQTFDSFNKYNEKFKIISEFFFFKIVFLDYVLGP